MADLHGVYARTEAGLAEIKARALDLTRGQRNLLIVIDGKGPVASFAKIAGCAPEQMLEVLRPLIEHGLVAPVTGGADQVRVEDRTGAGRPLPSGASPAQALIALAEQSDVVTFEFENVSAPALDAIAGHTRIAPSPLP